MLIQRDAHSDLVQLDKSKGMLKKMYKSYRLLTSIQEDKCTQNITTSKILPFIKATVQVYIFSLGPCYRVSVLRRGGHATEGAHQ